MIEEKYVDVHTHILPGVDDGAKNMEETIKMAGLAWEEGVRHIIATPHYSCGGNNVCGEDLERIFRDTRKKIQEKYPDLEMTLGNELLNSSGILEALEKGKAHTIGDSKYILVEFLPGDPYQKIYDSLRNYILHGYIPVVAHMERYECLVKKYDRIEEILQLGAYMQMNVSSLQGGIFDRQSAYHRSLVEKGYIQFWGSDCHDSIHRKPSMKNGLCKMKKNLREETVRQIGWRNPEKMLKNQIV